MFGLRSKTYTVIKSLKHGTETLNKTANEMAVKIEAKTQGTILEKWMHFWKNVFKDYKDVALDIKNDIIQKPAKAILISSSLGFTIFCTQHNPNATHFKNTYVKASNDLILVHPNMQRKETSDHLQFIEHCYNIKVLRHTNFGLFSIIWIDKFSDTCKLFEAQCPYLQIDYSKFYSRVVDIGFLDTWWILARRMTDYDVNY